VSQSVKEVLQSLVDDGLVQADKIGSSNCKLRGTSTRMVANIGQSSGAFHPNAARSYAARFPVNFGAALRADVRAQMQNRLRQLKETREGHQTQQMELRAQIEAEKAARVDNVGVFLGGSQMVALKGL
jgi:hypothetical protein